MRTLSIDIETYSPEPLTRTGVHKYAEHPEFEVLLFGYSADGAAPEYIDLAMGEDIPQELVEALYDPDIIKQAYNAAFEIACLSEHFGRQLDAVQWRCTSVHALTLGLPGNLADVCKVLKLPLRQQKLSTGRALIRYFCVPCKATRVNGGRTRNLAQHAPEKWELFRQYCLQDVTAEVAVSLRLAKHPLTEKEQALWVLDQKINRRGMLIDQELVKAAIAMDKDLKARSTAEFCKVTGLSSATQIAKLKKWLLDEHSIVADSLDKEAVKELLKGAPAQAVERALQIRQELSKSSVSKYSAMLASQCSDGRIRGLLQFYGANRTGRWAGRIVQIQNLPRSNLTYEELSLARQMVKRNEQGNLSLVFGGIQDVLSQLIRTAFIAPMGKQLLVVDFAAIEARVLAWAANEEWRLDVFRTHGKIYEASAAQMFSVPIESIDKHSPLRQKGKIAELALGYHGGVGALITMGALSMGLSTKELPGIVRAWRKANPKIMSFGRAMERHAKQAVQRKIPVGVPGRYEFRLADGILFMKLPSGRSLAYTNPHIERTEEYETLTYNGVNQETRQQQTVDTYAGKLLENYTQAVARDCLAEALPALEAAGLPVIGHVHDEPICEIDWPDPEDALRTAIEILSRPLEWAPGLPLSGDGFITDFYRKDA